jgi:hypothetical protein
VDLDQEPDFGDVRLSRFRLWVQDFYFQNREERLIYNDTSYTIQQYWDTYKWWLKREYRHHLQLE